MKMKEKAKEFYEKHEKAVKVGAGMLAVGVVGYCLGVNKYAGKPFITHDGVKSTLKDAQDKYNSMLVFTVNNVKGLNPSELGVLGDAMKAAGGDDSMKFTHFIAVGDDN